MAEVADLPLGWVAFRGAVGGEWTREPAEPSVGGNLAMNEGVLDAQLKLCERYGARHVPARPELKVGIARNVREGIFPINGLRHEPEGDTTGWSIWAGDEPTDAPDFFVPLHVEHLAEWCPGATRFLGLPPGWRFLVADQYEDVWQDPSLLTS